MDRNLKFSVEFGTQARRVCWRTAASEHKPGNFCPIPAWQVWDSSRDVQMQLLKLCWFTPAAIMAQCFSTAPKLLFFLLIFNFWCLIPSPKLYIRPIDNIKETRKHLPSSFPKLASLPNHLSLFPFCSLIFSFSSPRPFLFFTPFSAEAPAQRRSGVQTWWPQGITHRSLSPRGSFIDNNSSE